MWYCDLGGVYPLQVIWTVWMLPEGSLLRNLCCSWPQTFCRIHTMLCVIKIPTCALKIKKLIKVLLAAKSPTSKNSTFLESGRFVMWGNVSNYLATPNFCLLITWEQPLFSLAPSSKGKKPTSTDWHMPSSQEILFKISAQWNWRTTWATTIASAPKIDFF